MSESNQSRRVLFIAYELPPSAGGGVQRLTKFIRFLADAGWDVVALAADPIASRPTDTTLVAQLGDVPVHRLPSRHIASVIARLLKPLKRLRGGSASATPGPVASAVSVVPGTARPLSTRIARWLAVPDSAVWWAYSVPRAAERLHRQRPFDAIIASGPPYSALLAAIRAGHRLGVPVVTDLRDPWAGNLHSSWPTPWHARRFRALEARVMRSSAAVTAISDVVADEVRAYGACDITVIPNGFDPDEMPGWAPNDSAPLRIAFLGRMSPGVADPTSFFHGLALARERDPLLTDVVVDVIGPPADWAQVAARDAGIEDSVIFHGFKSYDEALSMVAHADVGLIILYDGPGSRGVYSGKLFDYLGIGIPILLYGPSDGVAADVVRDARQGTVVPYGDIDEVADALIAMAQDKAVGRPSFKPAISVRQRYDRRLQVAAVSDLLERVIGGGHVR